MEELKQLIIEFNEDRDWDQFHSPENLIKSISLEAAELLECVQWSSEFNLEDVKEELADVMIYCVQLAIKLDLDPIEIMKSKIKKNAQKYPVDKAKGKSLKYNEL